MNQSQSIEKTALSNLITNEDYARKVIPFLKSDYFKVREERIVFEEIQKFIMATFGNADEAVPSAHLLSEMLVGNIPLFDPNDVFRILGTFRNSLLKMSGVGLLTGLKRFDLPQLLGKNIESNPIISLAAKNKKFADTGFEKILYLYILGE